MNQNLLIVDDEKEILSWLEELFKYEFDMEIGVYTANSAMEAIRLLAKVRIDVVLTDIRMPGMDGITMFQHIKEHWPRCKTVFLTGYRNFDDIYRIINNPDVKYILKSEDDDCIMDAVREFFLMSRRELESEQNYREQQEWMEKAKYWLKREFMNQVCTGDYHENLNSQASRLDIPLDFEKDVLLFMIRMERDWKSVDIQEKFLQNEVLAEILQENLPGKIKFYLHFMENDQGILLIQPMGYEKIEWEMISIIVQGAIEYTQEKFRNLHQVTFSCMVYPTPVKVTDISGCLREMKKQMIGCISGANEMILKMDTEETLLKEKKGPDTSVWVTSLRSMMEMKKKQDYFQLLGGILRNLTDRTSSHDTVALEIYYSISVSLLHFINENHMNEQLAFQFGIYKLIMAEAHANWIEAAQYLTEVSEAIFSLMEEKESTLTDRALKRIVTYIDEHLDEELSLTTLADIGGFNASYLSRLFKQVQKKTISEYILGKRIELAKRLLADSNERIQDVAAKIGYISAHSFARAFRNEVGIAPTEYRELQMEIKSNAKSPM